MKSTFLYEFETKQALAEFIIKTNKFSMGPQCEQFEQAFCVYQGCQDAILFNSGGSANLALLQALKNLGRLKTGDRVGFSALTWSTNVMPILQMGLVPVAIDVSRETLNVMSEQVEACLKDQSVKALFLTNVLGFLGDLDRIKRLCEEAGVLLLEDNCESLGSEVGGVKSGNFGLGATFSFFVAHHMSTIEGGMCVTGDKELAEMLRIVRANGWDRNLTAEQQIKWRAKYGISSEFEAKYTFYDLGFNLRPTEITGFLGQIQLRYLPENVRTREAYLSRLEEQIQKNPDLLLLKHDHMNVCSAFAFPVVCRTPELRKKYLDQFSGAGIELRPLIAGNMQRQPFYKKYVEAEESLPNTEFLHQSAFYCGNYPELSPTDLETITSCLHRYE